VTARVLALALAAAGCTPLAGSTMLVTDARVWGGSLVLTQCELRAVGNDLAVGKCIDSLRPLPAVVLHDGLGVLVPPLARCAAMAGLRAPVRIALAIDNGGRGTASVDVANAALVACVENVLASATFPSVFAGTRQTLVVSP